MYIMYNYAVHTHIWRTYYTCIKHTCTEAALRFLASCLMASPFFSSVFNSFFTLNWTLDIPPWLRQKTDCSLDLGFHWTLIPRLGMWPDDPCAASAPRVHVLFTHWGFGIKHLQGSEHAKRILRGTRPHDLFTHMKSFLLFSFIYFGPELTTGPWEGHSCLFPTDV